MNLREGQLMAGMGHGMGRNEIEERK